MSKVFIIQDQKQLDPRVRQAVDKFDFSDARRYGPLVMLLNHGDSTMDLDAAVAKLRQGLAAFSCDDWLLPTGNPLFIGIAFAIAAKRTGGRLKMLQWSATHQWYIPITVENLYAKASA